MNKHLSNLSFVLRHKLFVGVACFREGIYLRGLLHDWHKFTPTEWSAYANFFSRRPSPTRGAGFYKPTETGDAVFDRVWAMHCKRSDHHWQWWAFPTEKGGIKRFPMSRRARLEMVCDWWGAGRAQLGRNHRGWASTRSWWGRNRHRILVHEETAVWISDFLKAKAGEKSVDET